MKGGMTELGHAIWWGGFSHAQGNNIQRDLFQMRSGANDFLLTTPPPWLPTGPRIKGNFLTWSGTI